jgi:peptidyl-prolyl cis-trans isomerase D
MLESIRRGQRWLTGMLVALIGGVFVFFMGLGGPLQGDAPSQGLVVELGDIRLGQVDFQRTRAQQAEAYRQQLGDQFSSDVGASFLDAQALRVLVERAVLAHEAETLGLRVGRAEIQRLIRDSPGFRNEEGKFDAEGFTSYVEYEYGTQRSYLDYMRQALLGQKMAQLLYTQGEVSEGEARSAALHRLQQVQLAYVAFDSESLAEDVEISAEEVAAYAASHEQELQAVYEVRLADFKKPEQLHLRHILFEPAGSSEPELARARERADDAFRRLGEGEALETLARELSDDESTRELGGDLGFVDPQQIASEVALAAASLKAGERSGVTRSDRGFHIVELAERVAAGARSFEEVRDELASEAARKLEARERAHEQSDALASAIREGNSLEEAARELEAPIERTGLLRRRPDGFVPGLGSSSKLLATAFALTPEHASSDEIFSVDAKQVLIQLLERTEPEPSELEAALKGEQERLATEKRNSFVQTWIDERRTQLIETGQLRIDNSILAGG